MRQIKKSSHGIEGPIHSLRSGRSNDGLCFVVLSKRIDRRENKEALGDCNRQPQLAGSV